MRLLLSAFLAAALAPSALAARIIPVGSLSLSGGQYFLDGSAASLNARADLFLAPVIKLSENQELVPVYSGNYSGTQDVQELAGGGVLTRQRQNHSLSVRYVFTNEFDKWKPRASYSRSFVRETVDEKWFDGLFDYETISGGLELEQERWWGTLSASYDFYRVKYPNYASLLSQSQTALDPATFAELSANAGANVLDNNNHRGAAAVTLFPERASLRLGYELTLRGYGDQAVVDSVGGYEADRRSDMLHGLSARYARGLKPLELSAEAKLGALSSNQNSYDASRTKFIGDYYGYREAGFGPSAMLRFKNGGGVKLDASWTRRFYSGRVAQDPTGAYTSDLLRQTLWLTSLTVRYPLWKAISIRAALSYQLSSSNTKYEATYRYNYQANNYLLGFEWAL